MPSEKSPVQQAIGRTIRTARLEQGHTQEAFALKAGIDRSYMGAIERGEFNLTINTLLKIAAGLNMPASHLLAHAGL